MDESRGDSQSEEDAKPLILSCPLCGASLSAMPEEPDKPPMLHCGQNHEFTIVQLLSAQSLRAESLILASVRFLDEQDNLVSQIAAELRSVRPAEAKELENYDEEIKKAIKILCDLVEGKTLQPASLKDIKGSDN